MLKSFGTLYQTNTKGKNKMNKRQILASLNKIANTLDNNGLFEEAKSLTFVMKKVAQEMMPESAETYLEPNPELTDIKDAKIDERIFTFVNRAMADHNSNKDGWMTLRGLINKDPIINRDKQTYEFAKKKAEKLFNDKLDMRSIFGLLLGVTSIYMLSK